MQVPSRDVLRAELREFDETRMKIVGGMLAVMFGSPDKIRDREWITEQFTQVTLLTEQFEDAPDASSGVDEAQAWIKANIGPVLNACFALFVHVADDMRSQHGDETFSASDAMIRALSYFEPS